MYVYVIRNSATGRIYIGQHKGNDLRKYLRVKLSQAYYELKRKGKGRGSRLFSSMRKHPREVWSIEPLIEGIQSREELDRLERLLIALYDTRNPEIGYNICRGGEGFTGPHSDETRSKIAEASRQMWDRPGTRNNFSEKMRGHPVSNRTIEALKARTGSKASKVTKQKLSISHTGLTRSQASREKQSTSVTGEKNHFYGKTHSAESRTRMSESGKKAVAEGRSHNYFREGHPPYLLKHSEETRAKMSESKKRAFAEGLVKLPDIRKPIRCIDTGEVFVSSKEVAMVFGGSSANLSRSIRRGHKFMGARFEYAA